MEATADDLFAAHQGLALLAAKRRARKLGVPAEELESPALVGLWQAARRFDPACGVRFKTFADRRIDGAIADWARSEGPRARHRRQGGFRPPVAFSDVEGGRGGPPEPAAGDDGPARLEAADEVAHLLRGLPELDRAAYALAHGEDCSLREVADRLGLTYEAATLRLRAAERAVAAGAGLLPPGAADFLAGRLTNGWHFADDDARLVYGPGAGRVEDLIAQAGLPAPRRGAFVPVLLGWPDASVTAALCLATLADGREIPRGELAAAAAPLAARLGCADWAPADNSVYKALCALPEGWVRADKRACAALPPALEARGPCLTARPVRGAEARELLGRGYRPRVLTGGADHAARP